MSIRIFDPHIHLWDPYTTPRPVTPLVKALGRWPKTLDKVTRALMPNASVNFVGVADYVVNPHLPDIYHHDTGKYQVEGYVHIQAAWEGKKPMDMVQETVWLESLETKPHAIIGQAHLEDRENLPKVLAGHQGASERFRGIRDMIAMHPSKGVMDHNHRGDAWKTEAFKEGLSLLGEKGLSYDAYLYSHQLKDFIKLAQDVPGTAIVLDHLGCPVGLANEHGGVGKTEAERQKTYEEWYEDLATLAQLPNVHVKLSGLLMPILGFNFHQRPEKASVAEVVDAIGPHIEYGLKVFGVDRSMFASNFPMDKVSVSFEHLFDAFFELVADYADSDKQKLFMDNALAFYRIKL
ncbi:MAG: amidohydrolase family protein [Bacteroidota bacterium]